MGSIVIPLEVAAAIIALVILLTLTIGLRRIRLGRMSGTFDLSVRRVGGPWQIGVARFGSTQLDWYNVFSLSLRPAVVYERRRLHIVGRRPAGHGATRVGSTTIVRCRYDDEDLDLALTEDAYFGLASWAEAAPPGQVNYS